MRQCECDSAEAAHRQSKLAEKGSQPLDTSPVTVVPPATVSDFWSGCKMRLDTRSSGAGHKDLDVHNWDDHHATLAIT